MRNIDRSYMNPSHMKVWKDVINSVVTSIQDFVTKREEQNVRSTTNHNVTNDETNSDVRDFVVTKLNMKMSCDNTLIKRYQSIRDKIEATDTFKPFIINHLISSTNRLQFSRAINHLLTVGLPFKLTDINCYHFKLPSKGPHAAVHFIWKQPVEVGNGPEQLKVVTDIRSMEKKLQSFDEERDTRKDFKIGSY